MLEPTRTLERVTAGAGPCDRSIFHADPGGENEGHCICFRCAFIRGFRSNLLGCFTHYPSLYPNGLSLKFFLLIEVRQRNTCTRRFTIILTSYVCRYVPNANAIFK